MCADSIASDLLRKNATIAAALTAKILKDLPEDLRSRVIDVVSSGSGHVELRTRIETGQTELVLVPTDGTEPLWIARTPNLSP